MARRLRSLIALWLSASIATGGCRTPPPKPPAAAGTRDVNAPAAIAAVATPGGRPQVRIATQPDASAPSEPGLAIRSPELRVTAGMATATPLTPNETRALLGRLEPLPDLAAQNAAAPAVRPASPPPPRSGPAQPIAFVVPTGKPVADAPIAPASSRAALAAPQITPQDEVRAESEIRIRFSEPMVAVAQVGTPAKPPATITPAVAGTWRWIDTRVATFTAAAARLPQATELTVTVPEGIRAISGATLREPAVQTFRTAPVSINGGFPSVKLRPDSPLVVHFDQDVDPAKIATFLRVTDGKGRKLAWKPIALPEAQQLWKKNPAIGGDPTKPAIAKHHVAIAPRTAWPAGGVVQVTLVSGAPSREGPRVSTSDSVIDFDVAPRFTVRGLTCWNIEQPRLANVTCPAYGWMAVVLANPIEPATYRAQKFQLDGQPFEDKTASGEAIGFTAPAAVGKQYTLRIGDGLVDIYGQPLIGPREASFVTSPERHEPWIEADTGLRVLDPRFQIPQWVITAEAVPSVRVQLYQVTPADYFAYEAYEDGRRATPPGKLVYDKTHAIGARHGANVRVDLRPALRSGLGHVVAVATAPKAGKHRAWLQVTKLGLSARVDREEVTAWVQDITPGAAHYLAALPDVQTTLLVDGKQERPSAATDATGEARVPLLPAPATRGRVRDRSALLVASTQADSTFAAIGQYEKAVRVHDALWYVTDDRFIYKPGETVYVKGWVRWTHDGRDPDLALPGPGETVAYTVVDARGTKLASGNARFSDQGGFHAEIALPNNANLGAARMTLSTRGDSYSHRFEIQEFRPPAFSVTLNDDVSHAGALPLVLGESIEMNASAKYYAGGGLGGAGIGWAATLTETTYRPPSWPLFGFEPVRKRSERHLRERASESAKHATALDGTSASAVVFELAALPRGRPALLEVDATVTDVDRMSIRASSRPILVHPSNYYVGVRLAPARRALEIVVTDIDGNAVAGVPVDVEIEAVLGSELHRDDANVTDRQHCKVTSAAAPVTCAWQQKHVDYAYRAIARAADPRGRVAATGYDIPWWAREHAQRDLQILADKPMYRPGDVAKLEIRSKVTPASAVVTFARQGIVAQRRIQLAKPSTTIELPIEVGYIQNIHVVVDRFSRRAVLQDGSTQPLPDHETAEIDLPVDIEGARLAMTTRATKKIVAPGANATFEVEVEHDGKPVAGAEVALMVVDEAILALAARSHADPLPGFYRTVGGGTSGLSTLGMVDDSGPQLAGPPGFSRYSLDGTGAGGGGSGYGTLGSGRYGTIGYGSGSGTGIVESRKDFRANAAFSPTLTTDARGKVTLTVKMPDSLTRFRIVALATSRTHYFGKAESTIVTQRKVNARTVAPRFLTQGDAFSLPIVVQNLDAAPRTIDVAVRAANLTAVGAQGKRVTIPGGQRAEVRFDFATRARGRAVIQTIATSGDFADASNVELPIYEPATTESFATYGVVDDKPKFEQLAIPADVFTDVGGVEVELASTQLQSLTDAYWYLHAYPYECAEQRSARMLATSAMYDVLDAFATPGRPTRAQLDAQRLADVRALGKTQNPDGGWGYFGSMKSDPFVTQQVLSALAAHKATGPTTAMTKAATAYVTKHAGQLFARLAKAASLPVAQRKDRPQHPALVSLAAHALTTLARTGVDVRARAERLHALATTLEAYPVDAKARVLAIVAKLERAQAIRTKLLAALLSATHETASAATVTTTYVESERMLLVSSTKTTALALDAIMREAPDHALVPKLARGVLDGRQHGRWRSTQENLVALQTMRHYFDRYEKTSPDYRGKLWLGRASYAEHAFVGHTSTRAQATASWTALPPRSTHDLAFVKDGAGRMYYRVGITYAPKQATLPPLDAGFIVRRSYTAVDDPGDVTRTKDGWRIKLGARVLVTLEALNTTKRHAVALVDPLPAGFEIVNERLATSERAVATTDDRHWDHTNLRDNRAEAFAMGLDEGSHRFSYTVRATTPGRFLAAPAKAEEMYSPETFGRSAGATVVIE